MKQLYNFFGSYGLGIALLLLLFVLTLFGTLDQRHTGLYDVQAQYFESWFLVSRTLGIPLWLPGGKLVLGLLAVNLTIGGLIRIRKSKYTVGIIIAHVGILFLIFAGLVEYAGKDEGNMTLYEGDTSDLFESYTEWDIEVHQVAPTTGETVDTIGTEMFQERDPSQRVKITDANWPFDLYVWGYLGNCLPFQAKANKADNRAVDGLILNPMPRNKQAEQNLPGAYVEAIDKATGTKMRGILFGFQKAPWVVTSNGKTYTVNLTKRKWNVPFTIHLTKFTRELYPGTQMPKVYESDVIKTENGSDERIHIGMNEPLRHKGYTFFQASWGPSNAGPNTRLFSVLAVVRNPSDHWPEYSLYVISFGMLWHFLQRLFGFIARVTKQREGVVAK